MHWPQITYIVLLAMSVTQSMMKHGQPREGKHNFYISMIATIIIVLILHAGGFFE